MLHDCELSMFEHMVERMICVHYVMNMPSTVNRVDVSPSSLCTSILPCAEITVTRMLQACELSLFEYMVERMCVLCYERAWYSKLGGCIAIKFLFEHTSLC